AVTFAVLGVLLYEEPDEDRVADLIRERVFDDIPFADDEPRIATGLGLLATWTQQAEQQGVSETTATLKREWLRLFAGIGEPEAPSWATYYFEKDPLLFGAKTLEVRRWYARFGLELERKYHEPDDHLGLMLQFLSLLVSREAEALRDGREEEAATLKDEQGQFLTQNVLPWMTRWQDRVAKSTKSPFYQGIALLIVGALETFSLRFSY
ncbi:MAG: molecular chaperone TorD family protein, partial [Coriobacteriales bacterium]|nr:molecular chaperone TorD family protein [Coriobacteriales bacterium]